MNKHTIMEATTRPQPVTLLHFVGWGAALDIIRHLGDRGHRAYYVPQGFDHDLRYESERDNSLGDTLDNASAFLVVAQPACAEQRVDWSDVIVVAQHGDLTIITSDEAARRYELNPGGQGEETNE